MAEAVSGENGSRVMMIEGRVLRPQDRIHDLLEVIGDDSPFREKGTFPVRTAQDRIYDLVDVIEKRPKMAFVDPGLREEIMKRADEIAEKIARELIPGIAERVLREEIEKLKAGS